MSSAEQDLRHRRPERPSFSRSPQPYHRKSFSLQKIEHSGLGTALPSNDATRSSDSTEDQSLEADDEKGPLLRLLAPPLRGRKGLRGGDDHSLELTPIVSPVPSPKVEKTGFDFTSTLQSTKVEQLQKEKEELYARYRKRRRTEIVRRVTETLLLIVIGYLAALDRTAATLTIAPGLKKWKYELVCFFVIFCGSYVLYPARRAVHLWRRGTQPFQALRVGFHIPSRFDPGILLYPVILPLFAVLSLGQYDSTILVNIILSLSSMPRAVVPLNNFGYCAHWILTLLPISTVGFSAWYLEIVKLEDIAVHTSVEELSLLHPLHHFLVETISNLVTTSLDPSEIQLLSVGLINLLVFASTAQAQILKALLWVGGLCLFISCEWALRAEVGLARIPAWRFARNRPSNRGLKGRINRILRAILPESRSRFALSSASDSDDEISPKLGPPRKQRRAKHTASRNDDSDHTLLKTFSADESTKYRLASGITAPRPARSSTFAVYGRATTMAVKWKKIVDSPNPYPRLNYLHAQALKILLAIYVYVATALIILLPVKYFISQRALGGDEAIGWAIGYFIGDIPQARMLIINNNLETWIKLPVHKAQVTLPAGAGWMDACRQHTFGVANTRLLLAGYCLLMICIGVLVVLQLHRVVEVDTRRKVFHGVMVAMLLPTIPIDPTFFALALIIVLAVFLMLDLFRASQLPPISRPLTNFLAPYVDGRDHRGPVVVSHIFLLIGCAIPLWLSLASSERTTGGWEVSFRDVSMVAGVICVGMGDAAASLVGRRYGRTKWYWGGGKSIEGSAAFAVAVMTGLTASWLWLRIGGWVKFDHQSLPVAMVKALVAGTGASIMESTLTAANDNVVVPIGLWLLVRGLRI